MAKLLFPSIVKKQNDSKPHEWFDELKLISSYSESELEHMILSHVETVFPNYYVFPFTKTLYPITGGSTGRNPDLVLIDKMYREWWLVEVETDSDDINRIKSQIEVFTNCNYNPIEIVKYILRKDINHQLIKSSLELLIINKPKVLVIIDDLYEKLKNALSNFEVQICIFQVFKNKLGLQAYRLKGDYPKLFENKSHCQFYKSIPNMLEVIEPDWLLRDLDNYYSHNQIDSGLNKIQLLFLSVKQKLYTKKENLKPDEIEIDFLGTISKWRLIKDNNTIYLKAIGINKVPVINTYTLYSDSKFNLYLKLT